MTFIKQDFDEDVLTKAKLVFDLITVWIIWEVEPERADDASWVAGAALVKSCVEVGKQLVPELNGISDV